MKTLRLFNSVLVKPSNEQAFIAEKGYIIEAGALWAKQEIIQFYQAEKLDGLGLNKTFHKSWEKILNSTRAELWIEQIRHYASTYGSNFQDVMYIPDEVLDVPAPKTDWFIYKYILEGKPFAFDAHFDAELNLTKMDPPISKNCFRVIAV